MSTRELSKHIFNKIEKYITNPNRDHNCDLEEVRYIQHLMELHFEPDNHIGGLGFESISENEE